MADPAISVVIPCYNAAAFLGETLRSAVKQTHPPVEVIVVDDGSSDNSAKLAESYGSPVRVIRQPNGGAAVARNTGVKAATGDWIAFLDADDLWAPTRLDTLAAIARTAGEDVVCIFNDMEFLLEDGRREVRVPDLEALEGDFHVRLLTNWFVNPSCLLVRGRITREVLFPEGVRHAEDSHHLVLLRERGRFVHVPEPLTTYRRHAGQLTNKPSHVLIVIKHHLAFAKRRPDLFSPEDVLRLRTRFGSDLLDIHEHAYWRRDHRTVRECRTLYFEVAPNPEARPRLFDSPLYPEWLAKAKDWLDRKRGRVPTGGRA